MLKANKNPFSRLGKEKSLKCHNNEKHGILITNTEIEAFYEKANIKAPHNKLSYRRIMQFF
jgi:hypothetical protein